MIYAASIAASLCLALLIFAALKANVDASSPRVVRSLTRLSPTADRVSFARPWAPRKRCSQCGTGGHHRRRHGKTERRPLG